MTSITIKQNYDYHIRVNKPMLNILGVGLIRIIDLVEKIDFKIVFQKGIGLSFIQNFMELYKTEIFSKKKGHSIIPIEDFTIFINYFQDEDESIMVLMFMNEKNRTLNYSKLYMFSKTLSRKVSSKCSFSEIESMCKDKIKIPKAEGASAVLIINSTGSPLVSKIKQSNLILSEKEIHIGGFLSAIFSFSQTIIGEETGAKLKEINFGNQYLYMINKNNLIFAFLVKKINPLLQRYMYLICDEFLKEYKDEIKDSKGELTPFQPFKKTIEEYFKI